MLKTYKIRELIEMHDNGGLNIRPDFQRRSNWPTYALCYFIDTLLRGYPIPLIYLRPRIEPGKERPIRDVVDGQQRLTAILKFRQGDLRMYEHAGKYAGRTYSELDPEDQLRFESYEIKADELLNASDEYVLDVFHRLNAFGVKLNSQELRHGKFQGGTYKGIFRDTVIDTSERWQVLWSRYKVVSVKGRLRMADDELTAQLFGALLNGVTDGGQTRINKLYVQFDDGIPQGTEEVFDRTVEFILANFPDIMATKLRGSPHFMMLFAAVAHALVGIPAGDMGQGEIIAHPPRSPAALTDLAAARENLETLASILKLRVDSVPPKFFEFRIASAGTTQRIRSRSRRFVALYKALLPERI